LGLLLLLLRRRRLWLRMRHCQLLVMLGVHATHVAHGLALQVGEQTR